MFSVAFEPFVRLAEATASGSQIGNEELEAYEFAVDYYGEDRVALQKSVKPVEYVTPYNKDYRRIDACDLASTDWGTLSKEQLTLTYVQDKLVKQNTRSLYSIFIHWPKARVSNEKDQYIDIEDLFARIPLSTCGLKFEEGEYLTFMRTTFSQLQWNYGYTHSHVSQTEPVMTFKHVCLGTGPILRTVRTLKTNPSNKEAIMLFFWELDKVVHVESLEGVPYIRMSSLTKHSLVKVVDTTNIDGHFLRGVKLTSKKEMMRDFLSSFVKAVEIPFGFKDGKYVLGETFAEFAIKLTNYYKKWKDALLEAKQYGISTYLSPYVLFHLKEYVIKGGEIYCTDGNMHDKPIPTESPFIFNGKEFPLVVNSDTEDTDYTVQHLIPVSIVSEIIVFILNSVNIATSLKYEQKTKEESDIRDEQLSSILSGKNRPYAFAAASTLTSD